MEALGINRPFNFRSSLSKNILTKQKLNYIFFSQILPNFRFESGYIHLSGEFSFSLKFGDRYILFRKKDSPKPPAPTLKS